MNLCLYLLSWLNDDFELWRNSYNIEYSSCGDYIYARKQWKKNDRYIKRMNSKNLTFVLGHNRFSHYALGEFHDNLGIRNMIPVKPVYWSDVRKKHIKDYIDWEERGAVTPVKDQGTCGSCWSFSTTGLLEGAYFIKYGKLLSFSEQMLVSCDSLDYGCNGGSVENALRWIKNNKGICLEEDYPYEPTFGLGNSSGNSMMTSMVKSPGHSFCCKKCDKVVRGTGNIIIKKIFPLEYQLEKAVIEQPIAVGIDASTREFQFYRGGVFTGDCGSNIDHGVLAVGFGKSDDGIDFWKVKNSWGVDWGMNGYILIEKNYTIPGGKCGIHKDAFGAKLY